MLKHLNHLITFLISYNNFRSEKKSLTSKHSPSLQISLQPLFIIFATEPWYFWLKAVPPRLEAVLKAIRAFMSSIRSGILDFKKMDSLQLNIHAEFDLI